MLISFIIPVYNVENYIYKCVESILQQSCHNYEIILVDDGSKDNSGKICDEFAEKYTYISVVHQENGGLSAARNTGIKKASGDYVLFVDSDDYIGADSLFQIIKCLERQSNKTDVMFLEAYKVFPDNTIVHMNDGYIEDKINGKNKDEIMSFLITMPKYPGSACTKLISKELMISNNLFFEDGLLSEDLEWTIRLLIAAKQFSYCDTKYYFYRQNRIASITNTISDKTIECLIYIVDKWASQVLNRPYQKEINGFMAYIYMILICNWGRLCKEKKRKCIKEVKKKSWIIKYGKSEKTKITSYIMRVFGIEITAYILSIAYVFRNKLLRF